MISHNILTNDGLSSDMCMRCREDYQESSNWFGKVFGTFVLTISKYRICM
jgi:hypothetical protein